MKQNKMGALSQRYRTTKIEGFLCLPLDVSPGGAIRQTDKGAFGMGRVICLERCNNHVDGAPWTLGRLGMERLTSCYSAGIRSHRD